MDFLLLLSFVFSLWLFIMFVLALVYFVKEYIAKAKDRKARIELLWLERKVCKKITVEKKKIDIYYYVARDLNLDLNFVKIPPTNNQPELTYEISLNNKEVSE